jgi:hypothetical protein
VPFETSQGITFTFGGTTYTATSIAVSRSRSENDISTTDLTSGSFRRLRAGKLNIVEIKVDWIGGSVPNVKTVQVFTITGTDIGATSFSGGKALCTGLSISGAAGELIRGSATFKVSQD